MNTKFKSYKSKLLLAGLVVLAPVGVDAKAAVEQATDTAGAEKEMVQVAYRKVAKKDILGGVSVVDVADLMKKNYNTYSLDNMQGQGMSVALTVIRFGEWTATMPVIWSW